MISPISCDDDDDDDDDDDGDDDDDDDDDDGDKPRQRKGLTHCWAPPRHFFFPSLHLQNIIIIIIIIDTIIIIKIGINRKQTRIQSSHSGTTQLCW